MFEIMPVPENKEVIDMVKYMEVLRDIMFQSVAVIKVPQDNKGISAQSIELLNDIKE